MAISGDMTRTYLDRLRGLSVPTRMLAGAVAVILVMGLFLVSLYAGRSTMVPLPVTLSSDAKVRTVAYLSSHNLDFEDTGSAILVNQDDRDQIVSQLNEASVITPDQIDFDKMVKDERMFLTKGQQRTRTRVATQNVLARMISQMSQVRTATVVISGEDDHIGIGRAFVPRTASVTVVTESEPLKPEGVDAIARMVAGSISGLKAESVSVIDARTGRAMAARSGDAVASTRNMETKLAAERMAHSRLQESLGYIKGIRISVNAVVESREIVRETTSYEDPKLGVTQETLSESTRTTPVNGREPGIRANSGLRVTMPLPIAAQSGPSSADTSERVESVPAFGRSDQRVIDPGGYALEINASIGIPRSYFTALQKQRSGTSSGQMPDGGSMDQLIESTLESIELQVMPLIATGSAEGMRRGEVTVAVFDDVAVIAEQSSFAAVSGSWQEASALSTWLPTAGLVLLAGLAVGMMVMMLRRVGAGINEARPAIETGQATLLAEDVDVIGEVDDADVVLDGIEINNDEVRRRVMLDQIREAVQARPEESASVLRRWTRTES
ncbi:MAG: hypothetical protein CMJ40_00145 [Phycisphaerae bacterium]|nr:hypothetical protein [Phycisphaerae bacterium]